jgi:hypothetical protein
MPYRYVVLALFVVLSANTLAQSPAPAAGSNIPVRRVVLYKTGVGYFEHVGRVRDRQDVAIRFTSAQLNDVLKSLTTIDLGKGQIAGISYNSVAPLEQRLGALRLPLDQAASLFQLLETVRGARVEVTAAGVVTSGRLLGVAIQQRAGTDGGPVPVETFSIVTDTGELRRYELTSAVRVRLAEADLRQELARYLDVVGSTRERDVRTMVISTTGTGERGLFVSYISEVPIWKSTYRLILPEKSGNPLLQGWAIVDNTIGEDWTNVELSLVAGAPQSFIQQISQPYYGHRPTVPLPRSVLLTPQTHQATMESGTGVVVGRVSDATDAPLPGVSVELSAGGGIVARTVTVQNGEFHLPAPVGVYSLAFSLEGFSSRRLDGIRVSPGATARQNVSLSIGALTETVTVQSARSAPSFAAGRRGAPGGVVGGVVGGLPSPSPPPPPPAPAYEQLRDAQAAAAGSELGNLFEYRIKEPVTLKKNQSALVPIINAEIRAEKVSLWSQGSGSGRPLRAIWINNSSGLTLDAGSITVIDGNAFAGEGLIEALEAGERRLVSYGADLGVLVRTTSTPAPSRIARLRARDGFIIQETENRDETIYTARNEEATPATLVIEHRQRAGWKLAEGSPVPEETSPSAYRFRTVIEPRKESTLTVREVRVGQTRISAGDVDDTLVASIAAAGFSAVELEKVMRPVLERRAALAAIDRQVQELTERQRAITSDQERVRENMKALRGSREERQLLQRYTRQLDDQESQLDAIRKQLAALADQRSRAREELRKAIDALSFEMAPSR